MFNQHIGKDFDDEVYHPFVGVSAEFLHGALDTITERAGSVDTYLAETLGVGTAETDKLRAKYLV